MSKLILDYLISQVKLGEGNYGQVFKCENQKTHESLACKILPNKSISENARRRLQQQIEIMSRLQHPNIVRIHDNKKSANNTYIFLELCHGGNLESYLAQHGKIPEALVRKWSIQLIEVFSLLKSNNVIHRDVKLANILLTNNGPNPDIKLADFGFSKILSAEQFTRTYLGTPLFMAPELIAHRAYTIKVDIWSIGVMLFELLAGVNPFTCKSFSELRQRQLEQVKFPEDWSPIVKDFISKMLVIDPDERWSIENLSQHEFVTERVAIEPPVDVQPVEEDQEDFDNELRHKRITEECLSIDQMYGLIEEMLATYAQIQERGQLVKSYGMAYCCLSRSIQLKQYIDEVREKYNIIESTDDQFAELYFKSQIIFTQCVDVFENIRRRGNAHQSYLDGDRIRENMVSIVIDQLKQESEIARDQREKMLVLLAVLELNGEDRWAKEQYRALLEIIY